MFNSMEGVRILHDMRVSECYMIWRELECDVGFRVSEFTFCGGCQNMINGYILGGCQDVKFYGKGRM